MSASNRLQAVYVVELGGDLVPEEPAGAARADGPRVDVFRVAPHEVAKGSLMRNLLRPRDDADLVDRPNLGGKAPVDAKNGAVDNGCKDKEIENLTTGLPDRCVAVFGLALLVESVDLGDLARLVVATHEYDPIGIPDPGGQCVVFQNESTTRATHFALRHINKVNVSRLK